MNAYVMRRGVIEKIDIDDLAKAKRDPDVSTEVSIGRAQVGDFVVSTKFFPIDLSLGDSEKPVLFETCVLRNRTSLWNGILRHFGLGKFPWEVDTVAQYCGFAEAWDGHRRWARKVTDGWTPRQLPWRLPA